jgi:cytochrome c-type biogenesis protein
MENLFGDISALLQHSPWLAVVAVFLGGVTTALNPCVLAMIPLLMGVVAGNKETTTVRRSLVYSLFFVLGLAITFTVLGLISALMGRMFGNVGQFWKYVVAGSWGCTCSALSN